MPTTTTSGAGAPDGPRPVAGAAESDSQPLQLDRSVTIPYAVYDAMQTELHDLRALVAATLHEQELIERKQRIGVSPIVTLDFYYSVAARIAAYRQKDYRTTV